MFMTTWITMDQERKPNIGYIESIRYEKCVTLPLFWYVTKCNWSWKWIKTSHFMLIWYKIFHQVMTLKYRELSAALNIILRLLRTFYHNENIKNILEPKKWKKSYSENRVAKCFHLMQSKAVSYQIPSLRITRRPWFLLH